MSDQQPPADVRPIALAAEDDAHIGTLLRFLLEREGFAVQLARDGREAMALLAGASAPAIIVLDIMLPYVDGFQLLREVRARPQWQAVPVIMLTARSQEKDIVRALDAGASDYIVKPFQPEELRARIRRLVPRPPA